MRRTDVMISAALPYRGTRGGVARYLEQLVAAIDQRFPKRVLLCSGERHGLSADSLWIRSPRFRGSGVLHLHDTLASAAAAIWAPRVHVAGYYGHVVTSARKVVIVYDVIHEAVVGTTASYAARRAVEEKRRCIETADVVISISRTTAEGIVSTYPSVDRARIVVARPGVDPLFFAAPAAQRPPYFLYTGERGGRKNFAIALEALAAVRRSSEVAMVVVSPRGGDFTPAERTAINNLGLGAAIELHVGIDDTELAAFYAGAIALVNPSTIEGFGLTIAEAMAAGTLVAASNASSHPEVGGDVAFYFDPNDAASAAAAMESILALDPAVRARRTERGIERARTFSWERCRSTIVAAIESLLER